MFCSLYTCKWKKLPKYFLRSCRLRQCSSQYRFNLRLMLNKTREFVSFTRSRCQVYQTQSDKTHKPTKPPKTKAEQLQGPRCVASAPRPFRLRSPCCTANWALFLTLVSVRGCVHRAERGTAILSSHHDVSLWEESFSSHPLSPKL